jgi:hydrogenase nickel incorporation protein HypA/HybF
MHELSIAEAVIGIATAHARGRPVGKVELKVGHLRQVVPSALEFAFELASKDTPVEGAELAIDYVPAAGVCRRCGEESPLPDFPLRCSSCGGMDIEVIRGEELAVEALELEEIEQMATSGGVSDGG